MDGASGQHQIEEWGNEKKADEVGNLNTQRV